MRQIKIKSKIRIRIRNHPDLDLNLALNLPTSQAGQLLLDAGLIKQWEELPSQRVARRNGRDARQ